ncbi:hypothetical protein BMF94_1786 [Rhodotorula taiwanensis]|uniref:LIM zinc-binding domain-containing protein n=1 Tax=Rhodotorula taiwanensis TaxID=741276 RepID=A0A2S5BEF5_9BASI|nr:hypothetical protein BMF94_1786 [Rhodotorula taiwanensis]
MHPIPPPRRSATLPTPTPTPAFVADPLAVQHAAIAQQHHRSLVAYYWSFAQQGLVAPLTAAFGSDERARQELARTEAVEWAKQCGIQVVEPGAPQQPVYALHTAGQHAIGALDAQPRLSTVPTPVGQTPSPALQRPLPTPQASTSATPAQTPVPPQRARPLPPRPPPARHSTASPGVPSTEPRQLEGRLEQLNLGSAISPAAAQPPAAFAHRDPRASPTEQSPAAPAIPIFSFSVGEDDDTPASAASSTPAVPTFSFACDGDEDEDDASAAGGSSSTPSRYVPPLPTPTAKPRAPRPPPLHPRFDPSHPSHRLYHPTSVMSPLSPTRPTSHSNSDVPEAGTIACSACRDLIFGRVLHALGKSWHPDCFRCAEDGCGARLEVMEFEGTPEDRQGDEDSAAEGLRGKAWCMVHYEERFALECHHCHTPIASADYVPISDPALPPASSYRHSSTRYYHPLHFFCAGCGDPFIDPVQYESRPAPASAQVDPSLSDAPLEAKPYFAHEGHPYCDRCDLRMWRPKCAGCRKGLKEEDGFLELPEEEGGGKWHEGCFRCSLCDKPLTGVYLVRKPVADPASVRNVAAEVSGEGGVDDVALPYCVECFDEVDAIKL